MDSTPCEIWPGYIGSNGYGQVKVKGKRWLAHRWVWTQAHGPIPEGLCVCHTCDNRSCVRLDHLWLGTKADNNADMIAKGRSVGNGWRDWTHCKAGHEYTPENTYTNKASGQRVCRTCSKRWARDHRARRRETRQGGTE